MTDWQEYDGDRSMLALRRYDTIEVRMRDGSTETGLRDDFVWAHADPQDLFDDTRLDIVAYRVLEAAE